MVFIVCSPGVRILPKKRGGRSRPVYNFGETASLEPETQRSHILTGEDVVRRSARTAEDQGAVGGFGFLVGRPVTNRVKRAGRVLDDRGVGRDLRVLVEHVAHV